MISWFEKKRPISIAITIIIAIIIFYLSTLTFAPSDPSGISLTSVLYHIFAFFFLALFLLLALLAGKTNKKLAISAIIITILYGISDEVHQFFVPGRAMALTDVFYDTFGIIFATTLYLAFINYRLKSKKYRKR